MRSLVRTLLGMRNAKLSWLADSMGMDRSQLSKKMQHRDPFSHTDVLKISKALEIDPAEFVEQANAGDRQTREGAKRKPIPLYGAAAGQATDSDDDLGLGAEPIGVVSRDEDTLGENLIAVRVQGDSMVPTLQPKDIIVVSEVDRYGEGITASAIGRIVVARLGGTEAVDEDSGHRGETIARFYPDGKTIRLAKDNPKYPPIVVKREQVERLYLCVKIHTTRGIYPPRSE
jgi:SOS-response transcriptional repressor LexA